MKAVAYYRAGSIDREDALVDVELENPTPRARDLVVKVMAISVNPADTKFRASSNPPPGEAKILGWDAAGTVEEVGPDVRFFKPGDEVFYAGDMTRPGSYAEYQAVDERIVGRKPSSLDWAGAAALPLTSITAWELLFDRLQVPYGRKTTAGSILILNGAGGVGSILTQLARRLTGLTVIATASRPETKVWCERMGAHHVIDHHQPLPEQLLAIGIPEVEYVAGLTNTDRQLPVLPKIIAPQGRLSMIDNPKSFDIVPLKLKAITIAWELMFTRSKFETPDMVAQHLILEEVSQLVDAGVLKTTMTNVTGPINASSIAKAHKVSESGKAIGKSVIAGFSN